VSGGLLCLMCVQEAHFFVSRAALDIPPLIVRGSMPPELKVPTLAYEKGNNGAAAHGTKHSYSGTILVAQQAIAYFCDRPWIGDELAATSGPPKRRKPKGHKHDRENAVRYVDTASTS